jgi:GNAT superfamily N-acetyltransferase
MAAAQPRLFCALRLPAGECITLRPIDSSDAGALQMYVRGLSPESRYNRFLGALHELPPAELDRVIHLDRENELALLAETRVDSAPIVIGEARFSFAPDRLEGEFALSVADDWRGKGLGTLLMADIECRTASLGARHLFGDVLRSNEPMKTLARKNGFGMTDVPRDARLVRALKDLARTLRFKRAELQRALERDCRKQAESYASAEFRKRITAYLPEHHNAARGQS